MGVDVTQPGAQKWQEVAVFGKRVPDAACAAGSERRSSDEGDMLRGSVVRRVYPSVWMYFKLKSNTEDKQDRRA